MPNDEIDTLSGRCNVSRGRILIWEKEGRKVCTVCGEPVIRATLDKPLTSIFVSKRMQLRVSPKVSTVA
jgi:hypothetical protein